MLGSVSSQAAAACFKQLANVGEVRSQQLAESGFSSVSEVADAPAEDIADALGHRDTSDTALRVMGSAQGHARSEDGFDVFQMLEQVGAQRAEMLRRAGFDTIQDVAESSPSDLADVFEIGGLCEWVAKTVFSSAHRRLDEMDDDGGDDDPEPEPDESTPNYDVDLGAKRVADRLVIIGLEQDDLTTRDGLRMITRGMEKHGLRAKHIGLSNGGDAEPYVRKWFQHSLANDGGDVQFAFDPSDPDVTPADRVWTFDREKHMPEDVQAGERGWGDMTTDEWVDTYEGLREEMVMWATHILVVGDCEYQNFWEWTVENRPVVIKEYATSDDDWNPDDDRGIAPDIDDPETYNGQAGGHHPVLDRDDYTEEVSNEEIIEDDEMDGSYHDHFEDDYQAFNQWDGQSGEYDREGEGEGSAGFII